jgi:hypothetical protein
MKFKFFFSTIRKKTLMSEELQGSSGFRQMTKPKSEGHDGIHRSRSKIAHPLSLIGQIFQIILKISSAIFAGFSVASGVTCCYFFLWFFHLGNKLLNIVVQLQ